MAQRKVTPRGQWTVTNVELVSPESGVTPIRGGLLLGAGVLAECVNGTARATLSISARPDGRLCCDGIRVTRSPDDGGVDSADLHLIPVRRLVRQVFASLDDTEWKPQRATDAPATMSAVVTCWWSLQGTSDAHRATAVTAQRLGYSRGHVSRVLTEARREGLVPR